MTSLATTVGSLAVLSLGAHSSAGFTVVTGDANANQWFGAAGAYQLVAFTGFAEGTQITSQYSSMGVQFAFQGDWGNNIQTSSFMYPQDGWGMVGNGTITVAFDSPMLAFAVHYPGDMRIGFYSGASLLHSWGAQATGSNLFAGFTSDVAFDRVVLSSYGPQNLGLFVDNVYFSAVPGPATLVALGLGTALTRSRQRRP